MKLFRNIYASIVLLSTVIISCQSIQKFDTDAMTTELCRAFEKEERSADDSATVMRVLDDHLAPYKETLTEDSMARLYSFFQIRLQRDCPAFTKILSGASKGTKGDWIVLDYEPESRITPNEYDEFFHNDTLKYLEPSGDTVKVAINDSHWLEYFSDGTYSKLSLEKLPKEGFLITFIKSTNHVRRDLSKPGEKYRYKLLKKKENHFEVFAQPEGSPIMSVFKLYFK